MGKGPSRPDSYRIIVLLTIIRMRMRLDESSDFIRRVKGSISLSHEIGQLKEGKTVVERKRQPHHKCIN